MAMLNNQTRGYLFLTKKNNIPSVQHQLQALLKPNGLQDLLPLLHQVLGPNGPKTHQGLGENGSNSLVPSTWDEI